MEKIDGSPKTLKQLLLNTKYTIKYYQREYQWKQKQIEEMIEDLTSEFLNYYSENDERPDVANYGSYFMGSVVLAGRDNEIIDGQQRLTSLTLLIIYLLNKEKESGLNQDSTLKGMVYSEAYGQKSFNINVEERNRCLDELLNTGKCNDERIKDESVINIINAYKSIDDFFPNEILEKCLLNFGDWLQEKVFFIEIVADTQQDAHKVFVSMNDRGLSLTSAEMLKGFILSEIKDDEEREKCNAIWKEKILALKEIDVKEDETFIKNWLRAQYAETIRETKKGAVNKDFDIIGTEFHKWVRENRKERLMLNSSEDYVGFINKFKKFADIYIRIRNYEKEYNKNFRYVYYNSIDKFTLQEQLILSSIDYTDNVEIINNKIILVAKFIDLFIHSRVVAYKSNDYNTIKNTIFSITKRIRKLNIEDLSKTLMKIYDENGFSITNIDDFRVNAYTKKYIRNMLARMTAFIEEKSGLSNNFLDYVNRNQAHPYDVEHITPDHFEWYADEYSSKEEFDAFRNNFADLIILKEQINRSLNDEKFQEKVKVYESANGNILGATLGKNIYENDNNPSFRRFRNEYNLDFEPYDKFGKDEINERKEIYRKLCNILWNKNNLILRK